MASPLHLQPHLSCRRVVIRTITSKDHSNHILNGKCKTHNPKKEKNFPLLKNSYKADFMFHRKIKRCKTLSSPSSHPSNSDTQMKLTTKFMDGTIHYPSISNHSEVSLYLLLWWIYKVCCRGNCEVPSKPLAIARDNGATGVQLLIQMRM